MKQDQINKKVKIIIKKRINSNLNITNIKTKKQTPFKLNWI